MAAGQQMLVEAENALGRVREQLLDGLDEHELTLCITVFEHIAVRAKTLTEDDTACTSRPASTRLARVR